ncbi:MAG: helix-turn-helix domain-containing protein [Candidatus Obscuribacterales bacterium]
MSVEFLQAIGKVVNARRQSRRMSLEELGTRAGLHRAYISEIERGARNPSLTVLKKLADALETTVTAITANAENLTVATVIESTAGTDFSPTEDQQQTLERMVVQLRERVQEQDKIIDSVPAMIWLKDANNVILRANQPAANNLGLKKTEIEGRSTYELYPALADKYHKDDLEVVHTRRPKLGIVELFTPGTNEKRWVRTDKYPIFSEKGEVQVLVVTLDITDLLLTHEALKETLSHTPRMF